MCYGSHCPWEAKSGPDAGECILVLTGQQTKGKCPEPPEESEGYVLDKNDLIKRLMELPHEIEKGERFVIDASLDVQRAKDVLATKEAELLLGDTINGKNAESRAAQLRQATTEERQAVTEAEQTLAKMRVILNRLQNEFRALQSVATLLGADS